MNVVVDQLIRRPGNDEKDGDYKEDSSSDDDDDNDDVGNVIIWVNLIQSKETDLLY
jgi:hypothetical protein